MLDYGTGEPLIRRSITRRLGTEPGVKLLDIQIKPFRTHIAVGVLWQAYDKAMGQSIFDLPAQFELRHVHNECDEIAEQIKEAWRKFQFTGPSQPELGAMSEVYEARGTGRRGNWKVYGERTH